MSRRRRSAPRVFGRACGALGCAVVLAFTACAHAPVRQQAHYADALLQRTATGQPLPALSGQVLLVWFFATDCFPCMASLETFAAISREWASRGVRVLAVGMDLDADRTLPLFVRDRQPPFPVLIPGPALRSGKSPFGRIEELPSTFLIGRRGKLLAAWAGVASKAQLEKLLEHAVAR